MPYLNLDPNYFEHPKTRRLVGILGPMSDVLPLRLWAYCAKIHPKDGRLKNYTNQELEGIIGWLGDPNRAIEAMGRAGFLVKVQNGYQCKDWHQHQGHLEAFSRRGKAANRARWGRVPKGLLQGLPKQQSWSPPTVPTVPHQPNLTVPTVPGIGQGQERLETEQRTMGVRCAFKYPDGLICDQPAAIKAKYCEPHIRKCQELKHDRSSSRDSRFT